MAMAATTTTETTETEREQLEQLEVELERWIEARRHIRGFLQSYPRNAPHARLRLARIEDGRPVTLTRGELTGAIQRMYARRRRVMEGVEFHNAREVTRLQLGISMKTLEREREAGFDELLQLVAEKTK